MPACAMHLPSLTTSTSTLLLIRRSPAPLAPPSPSRPRRHDGDGFQPSRVGRRQPGRHVSTPLYAFVSPVDSTGTLVLLGLQ